MKALTEYLMEGRKRKLTNPKAFMSNIRLKYNSEQPEYYKVMTDFFVDEILWKYPEISFSNIHTTEKKMGYNGMPAKIYDFEYVYKDHVLSFKFNNFFANPFCYFKIDDKDVAKNIFGNYGDFDFLAFLNHREYIDNYISMLDALV